MNHEELRARRSASLMRTLGTGPTLPPNYARVVTTLKDEELAAELEAAGERDPGFVAALVEEARRRGLDD